MKNLLLAVLLVLSPALSAATFEGKVNFKISSGRSKPQEISYLIKGPLLRFEVAGQKEMGGMVVDMPKKQMIMIMDEQRMYMVMDIPQAAQAAATGADDVKLEKTSETAKILGYDATKYVSTHEGRKADLWLAEGLGAFMSMPDANPMGGGRSSSRPEQAWERALAGKDLFPLRVVGYDGGGKEEFRMEATAVEKKSLPDSLFAPPAGYQKFDMGAMMQGAMPGGMPTRRR